MVFTTDGFFEVATKDLNPRSLTEFRSDALSD